MANQDSYFKGKDIIVFANGIAIGCDKTADIQLQVKTFDVTSKCTKDASGNLTSVNIPVINDYTITGSGFSTIDTGPSSTGKISAGQMFLYANNQIKVYVTWSRGDGSIYGFDAYFTDVKETASSQEVSTYSYTLKSAGVLITHPVS